MRLIDADELRRTFIIGHNLVGAKYVDLAPTIEPNLVINPDEIERGDVVEIGENIVVMHHDDYYDMFLKSELYDDINLCEDAISREDAIKQIVNTPIRNQDKGQEFLEGCATRQNEIIDILKALSPVAPSRPSGENLRKEYPSLFECSVCGASCDDTIPWSCDINFCPNCGAKMSKESE